MHNINQEVMDVMSGEQINSLVKISFNPHRASDSGGLNKITFILMGDIMPKYRFYHMLKDMGIDSYKMFKREVQEFDKFKPKQRPKEVYYRSTNVFSKGTYHCASVDESIKSFVEMNRRGPDKLIFVHYDNKTNEVTEMKRFSKEQDARGKMEDAARIMCNL